MTPQLQKNQQSPSIFRCDDQQNS